MTKSSSKSLLSIVAHPPVAVTSGVILALTVLPSSLVAWMLRAFAIFYLVLVLLDVALTKYHLWTFTPTKPSPHRYALVTGASSGIGKEIAIELTKQGYSLVIASRTQQNLEAVRTHIISQVSSTADVLVCACDLSKASGIDALVGFVNDKQLVVDILVNNAGASLASDFVAMSSEKVDELLTLDVVATTKLVHAIAPQMVQRGVGRILNISSVAASLPMPNGSLYGSSKAFIRSFSQAINYELRSTGVTITCFSPGPVKTNFGIAAQCEAAAFTTVDYILDANTCAKLAIESLFDGDAYAYDTARSYFNSRFFGSIVPARLTTLCGALTMNENGKEMELLRSIIVALPIFPSILCQSRRPWGYHSRTFGPLSHTEESQVSAISQASRAHIQPPSSSPHTEAAVDKSTFSRKAESLNNKMPYSNHKSLVSVLCHPAVLGVGVTVLLLFVVPSDIVVWCFRVLFSVYFAVMVLDIALTKYHLWTFKPTQPQRKRYALVTGASLGIGREIAYALAKQGYSLVIASRTLKNLNTMRADIEKIYEPVQVLVCACDLSTNEGIAKLLDFVNAQELVIDILVNNAGHSVKSDFVNLSAQKMEEILTLDVVSVTKLVHGIAPQMMARGVGRILNIGSMAAAVNLPSSSLYSSAKAFMLNFSQSVNYELRGTGVTVTCFLPGPVRTNFSVAADCEDVMFMTTGTLLDAHTCAKMALESMFNGDGYAFDTFANYFSATMIRSIVPARLGLWFGAMSWNEPSKKWTLLKR